MNLLFNFYSRVCVLVCMFHSSAFKMASNITPDEDEPMHPAGLDMTRGSLAAFWTEMKLMYPLLYQQFHWMQLIRSSTPIKH